MTNNDTERLVEEVIDEIKPYRYRLERGPKEQNVQLGRKTTYDGDEVRSAAPDFELIAKSIIVALSVGFFNNLGSVLADTTIEKVREYQEKLSNNTEETGESNQVPGNEIPPPLQQFSKEELEEIVDNLNDLIEEPPDTNSDRVQLPKADLADHLTQYNLPSNRADEIAESIDSSFEVYRSDHE